jgi:hypothetical protein
MIERQKDTLRQTIFGLNYPSLGCLNQLLTFLDSAIVRTLNANYSFQAFGLGGANTIYPISAFITDLFYLKGTRIKVDVNEIMASDIFGL